MIQLKYILNFSYHAWEINEWLYMNFISLLKDNISSQLFPWHFKISWGFLVFYWVKSRGLCVSLTQASEQQEMVCDSLCFYFPASSQVMNSSIHSQFRSSSPWNHSWSSRSAPSGESLAWTTFLGTAVTWLTSIHIIRIYVIYVLNIMMYDITCWHAGWNLLSLCPPELQPGWYVPPFYAMTESLGAPPTPAGTENTEDQCTQTWIIFSKLHF